MARGHGRRVAVTLAGEALTSPDGLSWTQDAFNVNQGSQDFNLGFGNRLLAALVNIGLFLDPTPYDNGQPQPDCPLPKEQMPPPGEALGESPASHSADGPLRHLRGRWQARAALNT